MFRSQADRTIESTGVSRLFVGQMDIHLSLFDGEMKLIFLCGLGWVYPLGDRLFGN
jgi:hypothetical protein